MSKEYIGSQQHWEDSINDDYDRREEMVREQQKEYDKQYQNEPQPYDTIEQAVDEYVKQFGVPDMPVFSEKLKGQARAHFLAGAEVGATHMKAQMTEELEQLRNWKAETIAVMPDMQAIGKLIGVPLGQSIHDKIVPYLEQHQWSDEDMNSAFYGGSHARDNQDLTDGYDWLDQYKNNKK